MALINCFIRKINTNLGPIDLPITKETKLKDIIISLNELYLLDLDMDYIVFTYNPEDNNHCTPLLNKERNVYDYNMYFEDSPSEILIVDASLATEDDYPLLKIYREIEIENNKPKDKFNHDDRFFTVHWTGEIKYGTVLHRRHMYGNPAVYMVNYDDPEMNEHNGNEKYMYKLGEEFNQEIIELCELYKTSWLA
jgi:hypothetical protein